MLKSLCGVLLAFVLALALAQDVGAKPRSFVFPGGHGFSFTTHGSNGYELDVSSSGSAVIVTATRLPGGVVIYSVPRRKHGERGFEAKLPGVGRIAVEFQPQGKPKKIPPLEGCSGRPGSAEIGHFVGTINFHGERDYTDVTAVRAKGRVQRAYKQTCSIEAGGGSEKGLEEFEDQLIGATLTATTPKAGLIFHASRLELGEKLGKELDLPPTLIYTAAQASRVRGMKIIRMATGDGPLESFTAEHTGRIASARVEPRDPFSGTADFSIQPDGTVSWTGDLSVTFPGTGPIPLTGKRFRTQLCVQDKCAGNLPQTDARFATKGPLAALSSAAPTPRLWPR